MPATQHDEATVRAEDRHGPVGRLPIERTRGNDLARVGVEEAYGASTSGRHDTPTVTAERERSSTPAPCALDAWDRAWLPPERRPGQQREQSRQQEVAVDRPAEMHRRDRKKRCFRQSSRPSCAAVASH